MNLYGIYKRNTIDNVPEMNALLDDTIDYCHRRGLHYVTCADVPGYMNEGCSTVHAYLDTSEDDVKFEYIATTEIYTLSLHDALPIYHANRK